MPFQATSGTPGALQRYGRRVERAYRRVPAVGGTRATTSWPVSPYGVQAAAPGSIVPAYRRTGGCAGGRRAAACSRACRRRRQFVGDGVGEPAVGVHRVEDDEPAGAV